MRTIRRGGLLSLAVAAALGAGAVPASADAPGQGSAYAVKVRASVLKGLTAGLPGHELHGIGGGLVDVNLGPLPTASTEGPNDRSVVSARVPHLLSLGILNAHAHRHPWTGQIDASASTADLKLILGRTVIRAKLIEARCRATRDGHITGDAELLDVTVSEGPGMPHKPVVNGAPMRLPEGDVTIRLNEQKRNWDGSLTVNAIHIIVNGELSPLVDADVILSSATCGKAVPAEEPEGQPKTQPPAEQLKPVHKKAPPVTAGAVHKRRIPKGAPETGAGAVYAAGGEGRRVA